jgi:Putative transposase
VYRTREGVPVFHEARAPSIAELQALLVKIITRLMRLLTRQGYLIEEQGMSYLAEPDAHNALTPLQAASCTYRIALGPRAGQKVLSLQSLSNTGERSMSGLCANRHGFSLHAAVRCGADQRKALEQLCRTITRPAIANERLQLKSAYQDGTTHVGCRRWSSCSAWRARGYI